MLKKMCIPCDYSYFFFSLHLYFKFSIITIYLGWKKSKMCFAKKGEERVKEEKHLIK